MAVVDPEDEIFWKEVKKAVKEVELRNGRRIEFERGARKVEVYFHDQIVIIISDIEPKQPALLVP